MSKNFLLSFSLILAAALLGLTLSSYWVWTHSSLASVENLRPWSVFIWDLQFGRAAPRLFQQAYGFALLGLLSGLAAAVSVAKISGEETKVRTTLGSARWASKDDIERAGLLRNSGVILGMLPSGEYLRHDGPEHVKVIAPTRAGKGAGLVIPTLLTWPGSTIVYDLKSENWDVTSGYRSRFSRTIYFNPNDPNSAHFNPLSEVRLGQFEVRDVQNIADMIVDPDGLGMTDHWAKTGHSLLVGTILHVLYAEKDRTLSGIANFLSNPERSLIQTLQIMMEAEHLEGMTHPVVAAAARDMLNKSENERSGVLSTAMSFLSLYRDPIIATNTCDSHFKVSDLMQSDEPVSLYLVIPPSDISRLRPLFRLIINQFCRRLTEELKPTRNKHRLLLLLDEFPALGRLDFFEHALGVIAGYGIKAMLVSQSLTQLDKTYGPRNSILDHTHVRVLFAPNTIETASVVSRMLGDKTETLTKKNYGGNRFAPWLGHVSVSDHEIARPLLTASEVMELSENDELIFVAGRPPIRAKKIRYYLDSNFTGRISERSVPPQKPVAKAMSQEKADIVDFDDDMQGVM
jgi:type IV secretion system protein VirD4